MLHVDPVLDENLVLLPLELEDCSVIFCDCWVRGAVDASPILESPALTEVVPYYTDILRILCISCEDEYNLKL